MRTLLWATAVLAVVAAIAGPYLRSQSRLGQSILLTYWSCIAAFAVVALWHNWRGMWRQPPNAGSVDFILWSAPKRFWGPPRIVCNVALSILTSVVFVGITSQDVVRRIANGTYGWPSLIWACLLSGWVVAGSIMWMFPNPVRFATAGVLMGKTIIPWTHIRAAAWALGRTGVVRLHRSWDGDIYASAPQELRREVESYLRQRTTFIGGAVVDGDSAHNLAPGH
jgi:hypothetical protein